MIFVLGWVLEFFFGAGDFGEDGSGLDGFIVVAFVFNEVADEGHLVAVVVDDVVWIDANVFALYAQEPGADRVKGAHCELVGGFSDEFVDSLFHFSCSFIGEGDGEDSPGGDALLEEAGDSVGDDAGFSGASASDDHEGAAWVDGGVFLFGVE